MNHKQIHYSLPKPPQSTLQSSSQGKISKTINAKSYLDLETDCPQTILFDKTCSRLYTHNMHIDYGKINMPFFTEEKTIENKSQILGKENLETKRFKCEEEQWSNNYQKTEKKQKLKRDCKKQKSSEVSQNGSLIKKQIIIKISDLQPKQNVSSMIKNKIVKVMVPGIKTHTKVLHYPDNLDYLKLCGLK